jgi:SAM-dependent methyltransferase
MINTTIEVKERIFESGMKRSAIPVHKQYYHQYVLEHIFNAGKNIYITPKVDGVLTNFEHCGMVFECEKLDQHMFLIDVLNGIKYQSYYTRFKMLESIFKTQMLHPIKSKDDVKNILNQYCDKFVKQEKCIAVIKPIFIINKNNINENDGMYDLLAHIIYNNVQYNTDGWIIYTDDMQTIKWKPSIHMTIDVEYHKEHNKFTSSDKFVLNNTVFEDNVEKLDGIYRCYYSDNEKIWKACEKREDKTRGNKLGTIVTIEADREGYYHAGKTKPNLTNFKPYYFDNTNNSKYNKKTESHEIRNICLNDIVSSIGLQSNSVLDIGCGNGSLYYRFLKEERDVFYTGIDIDPFILTKTPLGGCYLWQNINNLDIDLILKMCSNVTMTHEVPYDVVTFIHSLHFCENIPKLFNEIKKLTEVVIVVGIFEDYFSEDFELSDVKVKKQENGLFEFYYKWKDHKVTDKLLSNSMFDELDSWKIIYKKHYEHKTNPFVNMHQLLILHK